MRIRKRPRPAAVEVTTRAAPAFENKPENAPKSLHAEVQISHRSERLDGGSVEPPAVVVSEKYELQNGTTTKEEAGGGGGGGTTDLLTKSLLVVFERAGTRGLTAREAVAKLVEYELPGLQEGERSSVQVAKVLRTPDFVHLEDGKYFIYPSTPHAVVAESSTQSEPGSQEQQQQQQPVLQPRLDINLNLTVPNNLSNRRKRAPVKITTVAAASYSETSELSDKVPEEKIELKKRRRRPPSSQHELAIGPRQCKRYDGRGWQCTRETEEGFSFCEHHQALMNKRTLRLNLAKKRRAATNPPQVDVQLQAKAASLENGGGGSCGADATTTTSNNNNININIIKEQPTMVAPYGIEDLIHSQRRRLVKARSLKSIK